MIEREKCPVCGEQPSMNQVNVWFHWHATPDSDRHYIEGPLNDESGEGWNKMCCEIHKRAVGLGAGALLAVIDDLKSQLSANAKMLARQTDLAREAESERDRLKKEIAETQTKYNENDIALRDRICDLEHNSPRL